MPGQVLQLSTPGSESNRPEFTPRTAFAPWMPFIPNPLPHTEHRVTATSPAGGTWSSTGHTAPASQKETANSERLAGTKASGPAFEGLGSLVENPESAQLVSQNCK